MSIEENNKILKRIESKISQITQIDQDIKHIVDEILGAVIYQNKMINESADVQPSDEEVSKEEDPFRKVDEAVKTIADIATNVSGTIATVVDDLKQAFAPGQIRTRGGRREPPISGSNK